MHGGIESRGESPKHGGGASVFEYCACVKYAAIPLVGSKSVTRVIRVSASESFAESGDLSEREAGLFRFIRSNDQSSFERPLLSETVLLPTIFRYNQRPLPFSLENVS